MLVGHYQSRYVRSASARENGCSALVYAAEIEFGGFLIIVIFACDSIICFQAMEFIVPLLNGDICFDCKRVAEKSQYYIKIFLLQQDKAYLK
ncbi:hypothetical protein HMPREF9370_1113 [Neisseria wadsworthii 9715]|uniref:Uncharacterized protein n=1 Tax=Neisseria wadsworthii 9715 TaxID=1030841 RepID=G4CPV3_9NEIS|nr:hypothetical protein HMPREF9370_1113 [Neisseria wadsworthii 9715]